MSTLDLLLQQLQDTDVAIVRAAREADENPGDELARINALSIKKRRADLERRLNSELHVGQADLVTYHVERSGLQRYPALAVASALSTFQELVTAVFDALRSQPKLKYRPSAENVALSTLDLSMALPTGSIVVSMSVENERLIAMKSDLDRTFEQVFSLLNTTTSEGLREAAATVGIASITKAHSWAESAAKYGLSTQVTIRKGIADSDIFEVSETQALQLKEAIEAKSDTTTNHRSVAGELIGIDVGETKSSFHIRTADGEDITGKLAVAFDRSKEWAVHLHYEAKLATLTTTIYATGDEKVELELEHLIPLQRD